jgi:hypothetical protein
MDNVAAAGADDVGEHRPELDDDSIISTPSMYRIHRNLIESGAPILTPDCSHLKLDKHQVTLLFWYKCVLKDASLEECADFLEMCCDASVSRATICRELRRMGFTWKQLKYFSMFRNEDDRVLYWTNSPENEIRPGLFLANYLGIVDIDESGFYASNAQRTHGHVLPSIRGRQRGREQRTIPHYSLLIAVDARVGVISEMIYHKGTTTEIFYAFVVNMLIPSLAGTGRRIITMDRLASHYGDAVTALKEAGHIVIFRPVHSPTFAPVEWVFSYIDSFLQQHSPQVTEHTLRDCLCNALKTVLREDIMGYMQHAHMYVDGLPYLPYNGEQ